jgi:rubrerythrin
MPEFSTNFSGMKADRKLTDEELKRAIRFDIAAEYEAVQLYLQLAESTDNKLRSPCCGISQRRSWSTLANSCVC